MMRLKKDQPRKKVHKPYLNFEYFMKANGKNYKYLSGILNISISAVSDKINGWSDFTLEEIVIICNDLDCSSSIFTENVTQKELKSQEVNFNELAKCSN